MSIMFIFIMVTFFISNVYLYPNVQSYEKDMSLTVGMPQGLPCGCPRRRRPVCGSNMATYNNICVFSCYQTINPKLRIIARKACEEINTIKFPSHKYDNRLQMKVNCNCPKDILPVCGTDDTTYMNECYFNCYQEIDPKLRMVKEDACFEVDRELFEMNQPFNKRMMGFYNRVGRARNHLRDCDCPNDLHLVCGSDDSTYMNECYLECNQEIHPSLTIVKEDACYEVDRELFEMNQAINKRMNGFDHRVGRTRNHGDCDCPNDLHLVCGSDDSTYMNKCYFECNQEILPSLTIVKEDACYEVDRELFEMNQPINKRMNGFDHRVGRTRNHGDCDCPNDLHLVCGSDDSTYMNKCYFECNQEIHPSLTLVKEDACYEVDRELFEMNLASNKRMMGLGVLL